MKHILRIIFLVIVIGIIGYIWLTVSSSSSCAKKEIDIIGLDPPYELVITNSLPYAGKSIENLTDKNGTVIINPPYYVKFNKNWTLRKIGPPVILDEKTYGDIQIVTIKD